MNKKIFLINCILFFLMCGLFSQTNLNEESIKNYRLALESFENKNYGDALKYSEFAILYKRQLIEKQIEFCEMQIAHLEEYKPFELSLTLHSAP